MRLAQWRTRRARVKQKRTALQMLALSGVVRPSHIEPRYTVPLLKLKALNHTSAVTIVGSPGRQALQHDRPTAGLRLEPLMTSLYRPQLSLLSFFRRMQQPRAETAQG
jgi:hypothetical protein